MRPQAVIIYLSRSTEKDLWLLQRSLGLLDRNFNQEYKYPVLVFHEDFTPEIIASIRQWTTSEISFERIAFELPDYPEVQRISARMSAGRAAPPNLGYKHMCRFFANRVFHHPAMAKYDWYWRLDTDSFVIAKIKHDVFATLQAGGFDYGYWRTSPENPKFVAGLWEATARYIRERAITPAWLDQVGPSQGLPFTMFYNNFEIGRVGLWTSPPFQDYFDYLDRLGGIYEIRWGDAPIHTLSLALFTPREKIHQFSDVKYAHCKQGPSPAVWAT